MSTLDGYGHRVAIRRSSSVLEEARNRQMGILSPELRGNPPAQSLGQHTDELLQTLGRDAAERAQLHEAEVV